MLWCFDMRRARSMEGWVGSLFCTHTPNGVHRSTVFVVTAIDKAGDGCSIVAMNASTAPQQYSVYRALVGCDMLSRPSQVYRVQILAYHVYTVNCNWCIAAYLDLPPQLRTMLTRNLVSVHTRIYPPPVLQETRRRVRATRPARARRTAEASRCASRTSQLSASSSRARRPAALPPSSQTSSPTIPGRARPTPQTTTAGRRKRQPSEFSSSPLTCRVGRTAGRSGWRVFIFHHRGRRRRL